MPDVKHFDPDAVLGTVVRLFWERGPAGAGIQEVVTATGVSRSSLYATFGGKRELYVAALARYIEDRSRPVFGLLTADERGLPAIDDFFQRLIEIRCTGEHARWGCMVANAHSGTEARDPDVRKLLDLHHDRLRAALRSALDAALADGQLQPGLDLDAASELLTLITYGLSLRSRAGAEAADLRATVSAALDSLRAKETEADG